MTFANTTARELTPALGETICIRSFQVLINAIQCLRGILLFQFASSKQKFFHVSHSTTPPTINTITILISASISITSMTSLILAQRVAAAAKRPGTGAQNRNFYSVAEKYYEAYRRFGVKGTLWRLYNLGDVKFGYYVGSDELGNKYYEDPTEVAGLQRYCEYHVDSYDNFDADQISAEWHAWLHSSSDAKPGDEAYKPENWARVPISGTSDTPFKHHVGPTKPFTPNMTLHRSRGYAVGSFIHKEGEPDRYYMQPNHPLRRRKRTSHFFDSIDYNNLDKKPEKTSEPLRDATLN